MQRIRFSYFGYSVEFSTETVNANDLRSEANAHIIAKYGPTGNAVDMHNRPLPYVEPGLPFPAYVPADKLYKDGWNSYF